MRLSVRIQFPPDTGNVNYSFCWAGFLDAAVIERGLIYVAVTADAKLYYGASAAPPVKVLLGRNSPHIKFAARRVPSNLWQWCVNV